MTHLPTVETFGLLKAYFVGPERKAIAQIRGRWRSRKIRRGTRSATAHLQHRDRKPTSAADFSDSASERVLDAIADALLGPLALQAARDDDEAERLSSRRGHQ
jgi:hypothetical protein